MTHTLVYTFRGNRFVDDLRGRGVEVYVLGKLKEDIVAFLAVVERERPARVIGIALVQRDGETRAEVCAINQFGRYGKKVNAGGKESYTLVNPAPHVFTDARRPTHSFCNWAAYKVAEFVESRDILTTHSFIHFRPQDAATCGGVISFL